MFKIVTSNETVADIIMTYELNGREAVFLLKLTSLDLGIYWGIVNQITWKTFEAFNMEQAIEVFLACCDKLKEATS